MWTNTSYNYLLFNWVRVCVAPMVLVGQLTNQPTNKAIRFKHPWKYLCLKLKVGSYRSSSSRCLRGRANCCFNARPTSFHVLCRHTHYSPCVVEWVHCLSELQTPHHIPLVVSTNRPSSNGIHCSICS